MNESFVASLKRIVTKYRCNYEEMKDKITDESVIVITLPNTTSTYIIKREDNILENYKYKI